MREVPERVLREWRNLPRIPLSGDDLGDDNVSRCIAYALEKGSVVHVLYAEPGNLARRSIWPKRLERVLKGSVGTDYMIAFDEIEQQDLTFRLDRVREA